MVGGFSRKICEGVLRGRAEAILGGRVAQRRNLRMLARGALTRANKHVIDQHAMRTRFSYRQRSARCRAETVALAYATVLQSDLSSFRVLTKRQSDS